MILFPNAKINIGLDIVGKRADGYHNIETIMYPVAWRDILEITPAKQGESSLTISGRAVNCPTEKNLVMKAYRALESRFDVPPVDIHLRKIIPDGAGLGGGSADAAFTLKGLNELFSLNLSDETLAEIVAGLGADCPFFIYNRPMLCTGIGTEFSPIEVNLSGYKIAIVKPSVSVPTAQAYSRVAPAVPDRHINELVSQHPQTWQSAIKNDFEASVFPLYPEIAEIKSQLTNMGAVYASMSGSGSSVYGIFQCDILADRLTEKFSGCEIFVSTL